MEIEEMLIFLHDKDNVIAYRNLQKLEEISVNDNKLYSYIDDFIEMLDSDKSFIRVRGFRLLCSNAKWDFKNKIDKSIKKILSALDDEKPTAVRQYLVAIKNIIKYKSNLNDKIKAKLLTIDYSKYKDSMQSLIYKDVNEILVLIG